MSSLEGIALSGALHLLGLGFLWIGPLLTLTARPETLTVVKIRVSIPTNEVGVTQQEESNPLDTINEVQFRRKVNTDTGSPEPPVITVADAKFDHIFNIAHRFQAVLLTGEAMKNSGLFVVEIARPGRWPMLAHHANGQGVGYGFPVVFYLDLLRAAERKLEKKEGRKPLMGFKFGFDQTAEAGFVVYEAF